MADVVFLFALKTVALKVQDGRTTSEGGKVWDLEVYVSPSAEIIIEYP
jgi:hypothetical protein